MLFIKEIKESYVIKHNVLNETGFICKTIQNRGSPLFCGTHIFKIQYNKDSWKHRLIL